MRNPENISHIGFGTVRSQLHMYQPDDRKRCIN